MKMGIEHMIDHTMLKADAVSTIIRYCSEAREHNLRLSVLIPALCAGGGALKSGSAV